MDGNSDGSMTGMFTSWSEQWLGDIDTNQRNYGVAVADVDHDGDFEFIVAGFIGPNLVLKYNAEIDAMENIALKGTPFEPLRDEKGQAIAVCACDLDGDGTEEIYFLNTNQAYAGISSYGDKLFKWRDGQYVDLYSDTVNKNLTLSTFAGRSVACLDRHGTGKYGFVRVSYGQGSVGHLSLIEMNEYHHQNDVDIGHIVLQNNAKEAGIHKTTGGRGIVVGPILHTDGKLDLFLDNEGNEWLSNKGDNFLFQNLGNGTFVEVAKQLGVSDPDGAGRGVALADLNSDGNLDIIYGNYEDKNRIYIQQVTGEKREFTDIATPDFTKKSMVRTILVADFDNNGDTEILINNINDYRNPQPNRLYTVTSYGMKHEPGISEIPIGDALEDDGYGTGGSLMDVDKDGRLEVLLSHGEDVAQPLDIYKVNSGKDNNWLRVEVKTKYGAPARGATVKLVTRNGDQKLQLIDSGSGYLCQMEPIAHFGLGSDSAKQIIVQWPDGKVQTLYSKYEDMNKVLGVYHPDYHLYASALNVTLSQNVSFSVEHNEL